MSTATATATAYLPQVATGASTSPFNLALARRYARFTANSASVIYSDAPLPEAEVYRPRHLSPSWLAEVETAIECSVFDVGRPSEVVEQSLSRAVAVAAVRFFQETSDLLPSKPYIYGSRRGDLVAEFKTPQGELTSIISPDFVVLFSVVDGVPSHMQLSAEDDVRAALATVAATLHTAEHGDLAAQE